MSEHDEIDQIQDQNFLQSEEISNLTLPVYRKGVFGWVYWIVLGIFVIGMISWKGELMNYIFSWIFCACLIVYFVFYCSLRIINTKKEPLTDVITGAERKYQSEDVNAQNSKYEKRIFFLDNLKIVLTAVVVSHNGMCLMMYFITLMMKLML